MLVKSRFINNENVDIIRSNEELNNIIINKAKELDIKTMLEQEAILFIKFQEKLVNLKETV